MRSVRDLSYDYVILTPSPGVGDSKMTPPSGLGNTSSAALVIGTGPCSEIGTVAGAIVGGVGGDATPEGGHR